MMTWIAIRAIGFYQKFISPYKGFSCAHRIATGEVSCSGYGKKVISRFGLIKGMKLLNRRFYDCSWHAKKLRSISPNELKKESLNKKSQAIRGYRLTQGGFVDGDCGDCDISGCEMNHCDIPSCDTPHVSDCVPDCSCSPGKFLTAIDCFDFCDLPDDCGNSDNRHTAQFKEKRNQKNQAKYEKDENTMVKTGISLNKEEN